MCMRARGSKAQPTWVWPTWRPWWASVPPRIRATWGVAGDCGERSHFEDVFSISFKMFKTLPWKSSTLPCCFRHLRLVAMINGCPCLFKATHSCERDWSSRGFGPQLSWSKSLHLKLYNGDSVHQWLGCLHGWLLICSEFSLTSCLHWFPTCRVPSGKLT